MNNYFSAVSQAADLILNINEKDAKKIFKGIDSILKTLDLNAVDVDENGNNILHYLSKSAKAYKAIESLGMLYKEDPSLFASSVIESTVENGLDIMLNWHNSKGMTPLHIAAWSGHPMTFMALMGVGAYLLSENYERKLPLETAVEKDNPEIVTTATDNLIEKDDTETLQQVYSPRGGRNLLHQAAEKSSEETLQHVTEASRKAEAKINGLAIEPQSQTSVNISPEVNNNGNIREKTTPAKNNRDTSKASKTDKAVDTKEVDKHRRFNIVNSIDFKGNNPLIYAAKRGFLKASADLLNAGVNPERSNLDGSRPILEFLDNKNHQGVELLSDLGVSINKDIAPRVIESKLLNIVNPMVDMRLFKNNYNQRDYKENIEELVDKSVKFAGTQKNEQVYNNLYKSVQNFVDKGLDVNLKREEMESSISKDLNNYFDTLQTNTKDKQFKNEKNDCIKSHRQRSSQIVKKSLERVFSNNPGEEKMPKVRSTASLSSGLRQSKGRELNHG